MLGRLRISLEAPSTRPAISCGFPLGCLVPECGWIAEPLWSTVRYHNLVVDEVRGFMREIITDAGDFIYAD